jgi:hypothetical protein
MLPLPFGGVVVSTNLAAIAPWAALLRPQQSRLPNLNSNLLERLAILDALHLPSVAEHQDLVEHLLRNHPPDFSSHPAGPVYPQKSSRNHLRYFPVSADGLLVDFKQRRNFVQPQAHEEFQLHDRRLLRVFRSEEVERLMDKEQLLVIDRGLNGGLVQFDACGARPALEAAFAAGLLDEDAPHGLTGGAEKVGAALPLRLRICPEPKPDLMHQRGGLQRLRAGLVHHSGGREATELVIDKREQLVGRPGVSLL